MATSTPTESEDMTSKNGQKQVNDIMKRVLYDEIDQDGSYFSYLFMDKIFGDNRTCQFCGAYGSGRVPSGNNPPELYVIEEGLIGKQEVECVRCGKREMVVSNDRPEDVPTDQRLRIQGLEVRYYCKKITHYEVLHDLLELLHVAAIEDSKKKREKHVDVACFMMQKAKRVCEEWCKPEYTELRYKKYLRLREETLLSDDYSPDFPPDASEEYKEMYRMMASSFRANKEKVTSLLKLMRESLFDSPTRPTFMLWVSIAMMHSEQYQEFKSQYDPHTYMTMESGAYVALKERFLSLNIPVGIKKIPVVFILFELPRFYHYIDFLTRRMGKQKPLNFLSEKEKEELRMVDGVKKFSAKMFEEPDLDSKYLNHREEMEMMQLARMKEKSKLQTEGGRDEEEEPPTVPKILSSEQFRGVLLNHLQQVRPDIRTPQSVLQPIWDNKPKLILKIETEPTDEPDMTPAQLKETIRKLSKLPTPPSDNIHVTVSPSGGPNINVSVPSGETASFKIDQQQRTLPSSITFNAVPAMGINTPITIPIPPSNSGSSLYGTVETLENVPTAKLIAAATAKKFDVESLRKEQQKAPPPEPEAIDEEDLIKNPSKILSRIVNSCSDDVSFDSTQATATITQDGSDEHYAYIASCEMVIRPGRQLDDDLPFNISREVFGDDREVLSEITLLGPNGEFTISPLMFASDGDNEPLPVLPFIFPSKNESETRKALGIVARFFGLPVGEDVSEAEQQVFEKYLKVAIVVCRRSKLFSNIGHLGAIRNVKHKENCTLVQLNLPAMLSEAAHEEKELLAEPSITEVSSDEKVQPVPTKATASPLTTINITAPPPPPEPVLVIIKETDNTKQPPKPPNRGPRVLGKPTRPVARPQRYIPKCKREKEAVTQQTMIVTDLMSKEPKAFVCNSSPVLNELTKRSTTANSSPVLNELTKRSTTANSSPVLNELTKRSTTAIKSSAIDKNKETVSKSKDVIKVTKPIDVTDSLSKPSNATSEPVTKTNGGELKASSKSTDVDSNDVTKSITPTENADSVEAQSKKKRKRKKKLKKKIGTLTAEDDDEEQSDKQSGDFVTDHHGNMIGCSSSVSTLRKPEKCRMTARDKFRECEHCQKPITGSIRLCSGCKKVCYCDRECQKSHWKEHKKSCVYALQKELTG